MRILLISNTEQESRRIQAALACNGLQCPASQVASFEAAVDHASRLIPELTVLALSPDPVSGLKVLREMCNTVSNTRCLVVGPTTDAQLILRALREGADEYLDQADVEQQLAAALGRLKAKQLLTPESGNPGKVIAVLAASGGSGCSTLAANISTVLAKEHGECGLIDLRLAAGDLASMLGLKPVHTLADLCKRLERLDQSMFEQFFVRHPTGVHLLAAPAELADVGRVNPKGVRRTLAMARLRFPYVVVDLDRAFGSEQLEALWKSDVVLLVLRLDYTSVRNARRTIEDLSRRGVDLKRVQPVANGCGQPCQLSVAQVEEALGMKLLHCVPNDPARANRAVNTGTPLVLQRPGAKISKIIRNMAVSLNGRCQQRGKTE